jgi:hypothetical protein
MRLLNPDTSSDDYQGCDRFWDEDSEDVLIQLRPASAADHRAIQPNYGLLRLSAWPPHPAGG